MYFDVLCLILYVWLSYMSVMFNLSYTAQIIVVAVRHAMFVQYCY